MMAGRIDLTIGFGIVMWHILAMSLLVNYGVPWPLAISIVIACAALIGLINGLLVEVAQIDSFIATLGTGTILYALALWHTDGRQIIGVLPQGFVQMNTLSIAAIPIPAIYALVVAFFLWIVTERLPIGRHIYAIGANERPPRSTASRSGAMIGVFVGSGIIAGFAGCILAAKLRIGQANVGLDYLLPAWWAPSSAPPPSSQAGSTSGARCAACSSSPLASRVSSNSAAPSSSSPCSTAPRW